MATRETGNVKWFNDAKGYGFIQREDGVDVFVHYRAIRGEGHRSLTEGQQVEYGVVTGEKGLQSEDVVGLYPILQTTKKHCGSEPARDEAVSVDINVD